MCTAVCRAAPLVCDRRAPRRSALSAHPSLFVALRSLQGFRPWCALRGSGLAFTSCPFALCFARGLIPLTGVPQMDKPWPGRGQPARICLRRRLQGRPGAWISMFAHWMAPARTSTGQCCSRGHVLSGAILSSSVNIVPHFVIFWELSQSWGELLKFRGGFDRFSTSGAVSTNFRSRPISCELDQLCTSGAASANCVRNRQMLERLRSCLPLDAKSAQLGRLRRVGPTLSPIPAAPGHNCERCTFLPAPPLRSTQRPQPGGLARKAGAPRRRRDQKVGRRHTPTARGRDVVCVGRHGPAGHGE